MPCFIGRAGLEPAPSYGRVPKTRVSAVSPPAHIRLHQRVLTGTATTSRKLDELSGFESIYAYDTGLVLFGSAGDE